LIDYCSEINIPYEQMLNLTWLEFEYISRGYEHRMQRSWDYIRNIMAMQINTSMSKKTVKAKEIMTLPYIDEAQIGKVVDKMSNETVERMKSYFKN